MIELYRVHTNHHAPLERLYTRALESKSFASFSSAFHTQKLSKTARENWLLGDQKPVFMSRLNEDHHQKPLLGETNDLPATEDVLDNPSPKGGADQGTHPGRIRRIAYWLRTVVP